VQDTIEHPLRRATDQIARRTYDKLPNEGVYVTSEYATIIHEEIEAIKRRLVQIDTAFLRDDLMGVDYPSHRLDHLDRRKSRTILSEYKVSGTKVIIGIVLTFLVGIKIYQGSTFKEVLRWESATKGYAPITGITKAAPVVITSVGHIIPVGWRVKVTNVLGMKEINSSDTYKYITGTTADTLTINDVNSLAYTDYTSGGVIEYNVPNNLFGVSARMQIREKLTSDTILEELTTENGKIVTDNVSKTITILLSDTITSAYTFSTAVYSMELIVSGEVVPFIYGDITLVKEITR